MKSKHAVLCALCAFVLTLSSCRVKVLKPDAPDETGGVGRAVPSQTDVSGPDTTDDSSGTEGKPVFTAPVEDPESLAPFGRINWTVLNGRYVYEMPARIERNLDTLSALDAFAHTRFEDSVQPPEKDQWYPGRVIYHEDTHEPEYVWAWPGSTADRKQSTLDTLAKYGAIYRGDETRRVIYLTFDCGYEYGATEKILDTLKEKQAPATFFLTGPYARGESHEYDKEYLHGLIRRMLDEGHILGNHTNTHPDMTTKTAEEVADEMIQVEEAVKEYFPDAPDLLFFRPPEGDVDEWLIRTEAVLGYRTVLWSFAYSDYRTDSQPTYEEGIAAVKRGLHPGCVYLLHAESSTNADILAEFIDWVRSQAYEIVPLCDIKA